MSEIVKHLQPVAPAFETPPQQLLLDLYRAYRDARRHKRRRDYQLRFERDLDVELVRLRDTILAGRYHPGPSTCFIIHDPKMREVFAAQFRDRVVHHLLYNYIAPLLIPTFIRDSYSCIPGRGTHDGIYRLEESIRRESCNYSQPCYILKLDIQGYFMHINRQRLFELSLEAIEPFRAQIDYPLVKYLMEVIIQDDPTKNCHRRGSIADWEGLPDSKSLFHSPPGCGLPIGNLTSQLFSNVYMDVFDKYMVSLVGEGRYVAEANVAGESSGELVRGCRNGYFGDDTYAVDGSSEENMQGGRNVGDTCVIGDLQEEFANGARYGRYVVGDSSGNLARGCRYGRYVDDAYVVGSSPKELRRIIPMADAFLQSRLGLSLSRNKIAIFSAYRGVEFLGAYLKPFRRYVGSRCLRRMEGKMASWSHYPPAHPEQSINSFLGITSHYRSYNIRRRWLAGPLRPTLSTGYYTRHTLIYRPRYSSNQCGDSFAGQKRP